MRPSFLIGAFVVAIAIILVIQYWPGSQPDPAAPVSTLPEQEPEPDPADAPQAMPPASVPEVPPQPAPQPAQSEIVEPAIELPELAASDGFVLERIAGWQIPDAWLQRDDLLARAAVVVLNTAEGRVPRRQVSFLTPAERYPVVTVDTGGDEPQFFVDPAGYARYERYVDVLENVPPDELAAFVGLVTPLLAEALALLGERRAPEELLLATVERLDGLPEVPREAELVRPNVMYLYADPALEELPEFDKQMLRMGPRNLSRIRSYVAEFKRFYLRK